MEQAGWSFGSVKAFMWSEGKVIFSTFSEPNFPMYIFQNTGRIIGILNTMKVMNGKCFLSLFLSQITLMKYFFSALNTPGHLSTNDSLNTYKESSHLEFGTFLCWQLSVSMKYWLERKEIHSPHVPFCKLNWSFATSTTGYVFTMGKYYPDIILPEQQFLN